MLNPDSPFIDYEESRINAEITNLCTCQELIMKGFDFLNLYWVSQCITLLRNTSEKWCRIPTPGQINLQDITETRPYLRKNWPWSTMNYHSWTQLLYGLPWTTMVNMSNVQSGMSRPSGHGHNHGAIQLNRAKTQDLPWTTLVNYKLPCQFVVFDNMLLNVTIGFDHDISWSTMVVHGQPW